MKDEIEKTVVEVQIMKEREYRYTELGILFDIFIGTGIATIMFVTTGEAIYWTVVGISLVFGLGLGAASNRAQ